MPARFPRFDLLAKLTRAERAGRAASRAFAQAEAARADHHLELAAFAERRAEAAARAAAGALAAAFRGTPAGR